MESTGGSGAWNKAARRQPENQGEGLGSSYDNGSENRPGARHQQEAEGCPQHHLHKSNTGAVVSLPTLN